MQLRLAWLSFGVALMGAGATAQTTVTTSGGTNGSIPVFTAASTIGNSVITQSGSNVGIGTTNPVDRLTLIGGGPSLMIGYDTNSANSSGMPFGKTPQMLIVGDGTINDGPGIGLLQLNIGAHALYQSAPELYLAATRATTAGGAGTSPVANTDILGRIGFFGDTGTWVRSRGSLIDSEVYTAITAVSSTVVPAALNLATTSNAPIIFYTNAFGSAGNSSGSLVGNSNERMRIDYNGNVGIGTTSPQAKLEINGNLRFTADGSVQTTAWTGVLCGGDYAESVDVTGARTEYEPGDVMVVDPGSPGNFLRTNEPYSTLVAGIYSTKPGAIGRRSTDASKTKNEVPMAMIGIVPTKVSAENGPVKPGDLLVTSSTPGYAMKGTDRDRMTGAIVGKALGSVQKDAGIIEVLVTLQ